MTDIKPATPQDSYLLWKDKMIYGCGYMDSKGKRIDPRNVHSVLEYKHPGIFDDWCKHIDNVAYIERVAPDSPLLDS